MKYTRLWAHDGNNSLKRVLPFGDRVAADTRVYSDSDYILPRDFVNRYANEVKAQKAAPNAQKTTPNAHREIRTGDSDEEDEGEDVANNPTYRDDASGGDPTDGVDVEVHTDIDQCVKNWKAASEDDKKRMWAIFDEASIFACACRHGFVLWVLDMIRSGEL